MVASSGTLTPEEEAAVKRDMALAMYGLMDPLYWELAKPSGKPDNMSAFRLNAVCLFALTFPNHPRSREILDHVLDYFDHMLHTTFHRSGAEYESTFYGSATLGAMMQPVMALKQNGVRDFFADERFRNVLEVWVRYQTYGDYDVGTRFIDQHCPIYLQRRLWMALIIPFGKANFGSAWSSWPYVAAAFCAATDPTLAGEIMWTWDATGRPLTPGYGMWAEWLTDETIPRVKPHLGSEAMQDVGHAFLRDPEEEVFMFFHCGLRGNSDHHVDKGTFSLQAYGHVLSLDPGVPSQEYSVGVDEWFRWPRAHNTLEFDIAGKEAQENAQPAFGGQIQQFVATPEIDYVAGLLDKSCAPPEKWDHAAVAPKSTSKEVPLWRRHIFFVKPSLYVIWDQLDSNVKAEWNYHPVASDVQIDGNRVDVTGTSGVNTELVFLSPAVNLDTLTVEEEDARWKSPERDLWGIPKWIRARVVPGQESLVLLHPYRGACDLDVSEIRPGLWKFRLGAETGRIQRLGTGGEGWVTVSRAERSLSSFPFVSSGCA